MKRRFITGSVACLVSLATFALTTTSSFAQQAHPTQPTVGVPITGEMGITETVNDIMLREMMHPFKWDGMIRLRQEHEAELHKTLAPGAPFISRYPGGMVGTPPPLRNPNQGPIPRDPQGIGTNVLGIQISDTVGYIPPDSMGDVGPTQIVCAVNGRIRTFTKTTGAADGLLNATTATFFSSISGGQGLSDPQVRYDRLSGRWFVIIITTNSPYRILLAVSSGSSITGTASFTFFSINSTGGLPDYPSMGVDANAIYIGCNQFNPGYTGTSGYIIRKSSVLSGGPIVSTAFSGMATGSVDGPYSARGVDQDEPGSTEGYFIGVGSLTYGTLFVRRVTNPGATPTLSGNIIVSGVAATTAPIAVPHLGSSNPLDGIDDRLFYAQMRKNKISGAITLWTAHSFQVTSTGVAGAGSRNGSRWYEIQNMTGSPSVRQLGTLFDNAASNPISYWFPSVAMSGQGHMALGCSRAGAAARADVATAGRLRTDTLGTIRTPTQVTFTSTAYNVQSGTQRWGDYSMTRVDPDDDMTMWSFQEYCNATNSWGIRMFRLIAPPPAAISSISPNSLQQGQTSNITVTGTSTAGSEFFDPGTGFVKRLAAAFSGSGITVNSVTFNSPTSITLNVSVSAGAATGQRNLTVTNPDGQTATANNILTITPSVANVQPSSLNVTQGEIESGALSDLFSMEDFRLVLVRPTVQMVMEGISPILTPSQMQLRYEGHVSLTGATMTTEAFNFNTSQYDVIDVRSMPTADALFSVIVPNPAAHMNGAGLMRVRFTVKPTVPGNTATWKHRTDFVGWTISP